MIADKSAVKTNRRLAIVLMLGVLAMASAFSPGAPAMTLDKALAIAGLLCLLLALLASWSQP